MERELNELSGSEDTIVGLARLEREHRRRREAFVRATAPAMRRTLRLKERLERLRGEREDHERSVEWVQRTWREQQAALGTAQAALEEAVARQRSVHEADEGDLSRAGAALADRTRERRALFAASADARRREFERVDAERRAALQDLEAQCRALHDALSELVAEARRDRGHLNELRNLRGAPFLDASGAEEAAEKAVRRLRQRGLGSPPLAAPRAAEWGQLDCDVEESLASPSPRALRNAARQRAGLRLSTADVGGESEEEHHLRLALDLKAKQLMRLCKRCVRPAQTLAPPFRPPPASPAAALAARTRLKGTRGPDGTPSSSACPAASRRSRPRRRTRRTRWSGGATRGRGRKRRPRPRCGHSAAAPFFPLHTRPRTPFTAARPCLRTYAPARHLLLLRPCVAVQEKLAARHDAEAGAGAVLRRARDAEQVSRSTLQSVQCLQTEAQEARQEWVCGTGPRQGFSRRRMEEQAEGKALEAELEQEYTRVADIVARAVAAEVRPPWCAEGRGWAGLPVARSGY